MLAISSRVRIIGTGLIKARFIRTCLAMAVLLVVAGCGTAEFRESRTACSAEWYKQIPPKVEQRLVTRYRTESRYTGETVCTTKSNQVSCVQKTKNVQVPYTAVEDVDLNAPRRDAKIQECTAFVCMERFGNTACEP